MKMPDYLFILMIVIGAAYAQYYGRKAVKDIEEFNQLKSQKMV